MAAVCCPYCQTPIAEWNYNAALWESKLKSSNSDDAAFKLDRIPLSEHYCDSCGMSFFTFAEK